MPESPAIVWFRNDLRLRDNPALHSACKEGYSLIPLFILEDDCGSSWALGGASKCWLHDSLAELSGELEERGLKLVLRKGRSLEVLKDIVAETGSAAVFWNRRYEPEKTAADTQAKAELEAENIQVKTFNGSLLSEPWEISNSSGDPYQVFTPFWRTLRDAYEASRPLPLPRNMSSASSLPKSLALDELELLPQLPWGEKLRNNCSPGEAEARKHLKRFLSRGLARYDKDRDLPCRESTSGLSPYLHFGEVSPKTVWFEVERAVQKEKSLSFAEAEPFLRQLAWREFGYHLLFHFPHTPEEPLRDSFARFPWKKSKKDFDAWKEGRTGYPIVDAGMRELWETGRMHNRVRMIAASFLIKDLLQPWTKGAKWFWETLVDADLANNTLGWQWVAGCGADAAPYFRIFNPVLQGEKFDPNGVYVKRWVPELEALPPRWVHKPWECPEGVLSSAQIELGRDYPQRLVDHAEARDRALEAYETVKGDR